MRLGFLAVADGADVRAVSAGKCDSSCHRDRNAFVGRAEDHRGVVEDTFLLKFLCIKLAKRCELARGAEFSGIEKVRRAAAAFENEVTKGEDVLGDKKFDGFLFEGHVERWFDYLPGDEILVCK